MKEQNYKHIDSKVRTFDSFVNCAKWMHPYVPPPYGLPESLGSTHDMYELSFLFHILCRFAYFPKYSHAIYCEGSRPAKRMNQDQLRSIRTKRLKTKLEKTAPLFADEFEKREIERKAAYFDGVDNRPSIEEVEGERMMTASEAIKYLLSHGVPDPNPQEVAAYKELNDKLTRGKKVKELIESWEKHPELREKEKAELREKMLDIRNEPLFANI